MDQANVSVTGEMGEGGHQADPLYQSSAWWSRGGWWRDAEKGI